MPTKWPSARWAPVGRGCARRARAPRTPRAPGARRARRAARAAARRRSAPRAPRRRPRRAGESSTSKRARELREPRELVGHGRDHRAPEPLHAPLEVHRGSLALERGGRGEDEVGPADRERVEHRDRDHGVGAAPRAPGRPAIRRPRRRTRRAARSARDPTRRRPRRRPTPPRRRAGSGSRAGGTRRTRACRRSRARAPPRPAVRRRPRRGPTRRARRGPMRGAACRARVSASTSSAQRIGRAADRRRHRSARADRDDLGACAARLPEPEVDHGRAIDDVVVADDDDELGVSDRRERRPERVERG